jgi:hypothetical protein
MLTIKRTKSGDTTYFFEMKKIEKSKTVQEYIPIPIPIPIIKKIYNENDLIDNWYNRRYKIINKVALIIINLTNSLVTTRSEITYNHGGMFNDIIKFLYRTSNK